MPLKILVAENDPVALRIMSESLENKFEIISAKNPDEAKLVFQNNPLLGAIVMDVRLVDDKDAKDQSGWQLAQEARDSGAARAPIIMYSKWAPTPGPVDQLSKGNLPRISNLEKEATPDALAAKILEEIRLNLSEATNLEAIPRYHQPPIIAFAPINGVERLADELRKRGETTEILTDFADLETAVNIYPSAMFAVDVADQVGLDAIGFLNKSRGISDQNFYIAALTSGDKFRNEALKVGVNAFVVKDSPQTDALELMMRKTEYKIEIEKSAAAKPQTQLALSHYRELVAELENAKRFPDDGIASSLNIVQRAMNWPFLKPNEKLILTALYLRMLADGESQVDPETLDICIEGALMLAKDRADSGDVQGWMERARRHSADFTLTWLDDDVLSGDGEEGDG